MLVGILSLSKKVGYLIIDILRHYNPVS